MVYIMQSALLSSVKALSVAVPGVASSSFRFLVFGGGVTGTSVVAG